MKERLRRFSTQKCPKEIKLSIFFRQIKFLSMLSTLCETFILFFLRLACILSLSGDFQKSMCVFMCLRLKGTSNKYEIQLCLSRTQIELFSRVNKFSTSSRLHCMIDKHSFFEFSERVD